MQNIIKNLKQSGEEFFIKKTRERKANYYPFPKDLNPLLKNILIKNNIKKLYSHQITAYTKIKENKNVVVVTPTASGKTLTYNLPVLEELLKNQSSTALYLFPTKALAQDQLKNLKELIMLTEKNIKAEIYDGDTPQHTRQKIKKDMPQIIVTNPDMLHLAILPFYSSWIYLLKNLKYIVIDEIHTYRGVFGSHFAQLIRRLKRILNILNSHPQFICCSATINNPQEFAEKILGEKVFVVAENGARTYAKDFIFLNTQQNTYTQAVNIFTQCLSANLKTIVFTKSRKIAELIYRWTIESNPKFLNYIAPYRAGYMPLERREIENKLFSGDLLGVVSTSALELGIDVGALDACILVGYPGSIMSTYQRAGRVGRERESLIFFIPMEDILDRYFVQNPDNFFSRQCEEAIVDTENNFILKNHILCAAAEHPLKKEDLKFFAIKETDKCIKELIKEKKLLLNNQQNLFYCNIPRVHRTVNIRAIGEIYQIINLTTNKTIGTVEFPKVYRECHPGAIYLHNGEEFLVEDLDLIKKIAYVKKLNSDYYTRVHSTEEVTILEKQAEKNYKLKKDKLSLFVLKVLVKETVFGYEKRKISTGEKICDEELSLPPHDFITTSFTMFLPNFLREDIIKKNRDFLGGLHGAEHSLIAALPLFVLCDRWDLGGVSYDIYPEVNLPCIFIYDGHEGGVGLSQKAFSLHNNLFKETYNLVNNCQCDDGCPSCIQSPKCGSGNKPLDKKSAVKILQILNQK